MQVHITFLANDEDYVHTYVTRAICITVCTMIKSQKFPKEITQFTSPRIVKHTKSSTKNTRYSRDRDFSRIVVGPRVFANLNALFCARI